MTQPNATESLRDLQPLAEKIVAGAGTLAERLNGPATGETTLEDLEKLSEAAGWFQRAIEEGGDLDSSRHDLKNKLNHILGPVQFIESAPENAAGRAEIESLHALCRSCLSILNGGPAAGPEPVDLKPAAETGLILVADDEPENREILGRLLTRQGHEIDFAENGRVALQKIRESDFDAVLLDINMPEMDGFAVLEALRESGHLRHTPVIVVTGLQEERDAVRCIEIGAEDFLSRPIRPAFLTARVNASLEKKRLREQMFAQHFTPELARELARNPNPTRMKGRNAEVSVLFCDIRGFSAISERLGPEPTIDWLGGVMGEFSSSVLDHGGVLVDYTGDELLAMWGAPSEQPDHAEQACDSALEMIAKLPDLNAIWRGKIDAETAVGIGISTGEALVGNVGTHRKFKYGPLGTTVNLGSRVQRATKYLRTTLLATGDTVQSLDGDRFCCRRLCRARVRNIVEPVEIFEIALPGQESWPDLRTRYEEALGCYEDREFRRASAILGELLVRFAGDGPSLQLMSRVVEAMLPDAAGFDPVWELPGK